MEQPQPQYEFCYQRVELFKTESLGIGSYGAVCKAMCDDLPCAAKILHPALFQFTAPGSTSAMIKFEQECHLLSAIKHPHIVQYLGTYRDPESRLPVLLMELMDESLTQFLEQSHEPLPYHTEVNLCHDIALALSYLHSNGIVHRDLSSNNVLLIAGSRAKVTDFGMVKLYDVNYTTAHLTPLTLCPGTVVYMSPEALGEPPVYTDKLDSFSLGVLGVQIMTRQFPDPGDRFKIIEINDTRAPSGRVKVDVPEIKRRRSHINLIDRAHPLLPVALDCLKDRDRERPSCHELCGHMSTLKSSPKYTESVQQSQVNTKPTRSASRESREREIQQSQQIQYLQQQLHTQKKKLHEEHDQLREKEHKNQQQQQQILRLENLLTATNNQLQTLQRQLTTTDGQLQQKEAAIATHQQVIQQLRQQLEKVTEEFQKHLLAKEDEKRQLQQQPRQRGGQEVEASAQQSQVNTKPIQSANRESRERQSQQIRDLQQQLHILSDQLQEKEQETQQLQQKILSLRHLLTVANDQLQTLQRKLTTKDGQLVVKKEQLAGKNHQLQQKEAAHQQDIQKLRQQLEEETAKFQQNLLKREKTIRDQQRLLKELEQQLRQRGGPRREEVEASGAAARCSPEDGSTKLKWRDGGGALHKKWGKVAADVTVPKQSPSEALHEDMNLSTVKHTPVVTDTHSYCNVGAPERKGEMNLSTVKHTPVVTDAHSYCNIDDVAELKGDTNLYTVKHTHGYYLIDYPAKLEGGMNLSTVKHTLVVTDTRGCCDIDIPSPDDESESLTTVKHTPVVTDAHSYCNVGAPELKGEMNPSTIKHTPVVTDAHSYCNIDDVAELKGEMNPSTVKHTPVVTDAHSYCNIDDVAELIDQEQANEAEISLQEVQDKGPPPIPLRNFPPKPPLHYENISSLLGSSVLPPLPKCDHPKPSAFARRE